MVGAFRPGRLIPLLSLAAALAAGGPPAAAQSFINFESGQTRPLAASPDGTRLFAVNTPDNRLEIFTVASGGLTHTGSVPVGLEPIAVAARSNGEVWVVNLLSDSVSVVDVAATPPRVVRTLLTCDEPRDIVFAGPGNGRAFVTTARRGQNCPVPDRPAQASTPRAIVQVFDVVTSLDATFEGTPIANVELFGDVPRALARSADGSTVYAGVFQSGNQTTALNETLVCDGGAGAPPCGTGGVFPGGLPAPNTDRFGEPQPEVGLIVKFDPLAGIWADELGRNWNGAVRFTLPDLDVFAIDANAAVPAQTASFPHVGTVLFNIATNPVSGKVYVSNTEARNEVRFEGPGAFFGSSTVQGHLHEARITVIDGSTVTPRHLNKHIDYDVRPAPAGTKEKSLAQPLEMVVSSDGATLYVAAFGSSKIGVFSTAALENDAFVPSAADHIPVSGGGPTGVVLDEARNQLYVFTRFDNSISVVDLATRTESAHVPVHTPEPPAVLAGRRFLYDATLTSSNGEASCGSCHIFGDLDHLAWDLGNPDDETIPNPLPVRIPPLGNTFVDFHPMKGPMTTQSLRGMANAGSMHWRGDRTGGNDPGGDAFDEDAAFKKFNPAFVGLVGRETELTDDEMQAFTDFILGVTYPPNPYRRLDNGLRDVELAGRNLYFGRNTDVLFNCNGCHRLDRAQGFFGTDGFSTFEGETQMFKVPHLRNVYTKIGMFQAGGSNPPQPQTRGYGVLHDGSVDTVSNFLGASVFQLSNQEQNQLQRFMFVFDSNLFPMAGQQVGFDAATAVDAAARLDLMLARDDAGDCDVIVQGVIDGQARGGYRRADGLYQMDRVTDVRADADLRVLAVLPGQGLTFTCAPPGSAERMAVDRDEDGFFDGDELDGGSDPADAASVPLTPVVTTALTLNDDATAPIDPKKRKLSFRSAGSRSLPSGVTTPAWDSAGDPTIGGSTGGAFLTVHDGDGQVATVRLPASGWQRIGSATNPGYKYLDKQGVSGPISTVVLKGNVLKIKGKGDGLLPLTGAPRGSVSLRFQLNASFGFCASAPAKSPATKNDTTTKFSAVPKTPAPAACVALP